MENFPVDNMQNIQWFPGHMTKTKRLIKADIKLVNVIVEVLDARVPFCSKNPDIYELVNNKPRLIVLNKCDIADPLMTEKWVDFYKKRQIVAIPVDCKSGRGIENILSNVKKLLQTEIELKRHKGIKNYRIKMMIVGVPNSGKSSIINRLAKRKIAKVEDRPGVTRGKQWAKISNDVELLDTPGVLWPKFSDQIVGEKLAFIGSIKDTVVDTELLAMRLLEFLILKYKLSLQNRYKLNDDDFNVLNSYELLSKIAKKRGMVLSGGHLDTERTAILLLDEFRACKIARITLDDVDDYLHLKESNI